MTLRSIATGARLRRNSTPTIWGEPAVRRQAEIFSGELCCAAPPAVAWHRDRARPGVPDPRWPRPVLCPQTTRSGASRTPSAAKSPASAPGSAQGSPAPRRGWQKLELGTRRARFSSIPLSLAIFYPPAKPSASWPHKHLPRQHSSNSFLDAGREEPASSSPAGRAVGPATRLASPSRTAHRHPNRRGNGPRRILPFGRCRA